MSTTSIRSSADYQRAIKRMQRKFKTLEREMPMASAQAIYGCLADTLEKSVPRAPLDEGSLRESGHVSVNGVRHIRGTVEGGTVELTDYDPTPSTEAVEFEIGYSVEGGGSGREGDVNTYAIIQHEHTEFNHPKGGEAKFLETAIAEERPKWKKRIADEMRDKARKAR